MAKTRNNKNYKSKGFKKEHNPKRNSEMEYSTSKCPGNDFAWYNKNPQLLTSASSLIFSKRYGDVYKSLSYTGSGFNLNDTGNRSVAGVVRADYYPFVSAMGTDADPINMAAKNLYTWLRHKNSGAKVYEQSDLIQVMLASGSVKAAIEYAKKLLRCVASYSAVNRFAMRHVIPFPDTEFNIMVANLANYTARLNMIIAKATSIIIPKDIPLFSRWKWLSANVWKDDSLAKCSYYSFRPQILWHYDWATHKTTEQSLITTTFISLLNTIEGEIDNLLSYDDYGTISGDILKAYGEGAIDVTTGMNLGEIQDPTYDMDAIKQFKNMVVVSGSFAQYELDQVGGNSQLLYTKSSDTILQGLLPGKFAYVPSVNDNPYDTGIVYLPKLVVSSDQPSVEECVEQTRLTAVIKSFEYGSNDYRLYLEDVGTEIITGCKAFYFADYNFAQLLGTDSLETMQFLEESSSSDTRDFIRSKAISIGVHGDPQFVLCWKDGQNIDFIQYFDGDNITVLDEQYLATVHKACVLSEWTMPMFSFLEVKQ